MSDQLQLIAPEPAEPIGPPHPADVIREEMKERRWSIEDLALHMGPESEYGCNYVTVEVLFALRGDRHVRIGADTCAALARAFEVDPDFFTNLEAAWLASRTN